MNCRNREKNGGCGAERQEKARIENRERTRGDEESGRKRQYVCRRPAQVQDAGGKIHDRHERRAVDRRAAADKIGVRQQRGDRGGHRQPAERAGDSKAEKREARKDGNVAAGDRDDVIRPRFLEAPLELIIEAGPVSDHDRPDNRRRPGAPSSDGGIDRRAGERPRPSRKLLERVAVLDNFDERRTLHNADEPRAAAREGPFLVWNARVQIARWPPQLCGHANRPAGAPALSLAKRERT